MLSYFQNKYAMSKEGARDLVHSIIWSFLLDLSFMLPVLLGFRFLDTHVNALLNKSNVILDYKFYLVLSLGAFLVMFFIAYMQYNSTYTKIYEESARRRISLAETLRKLPLAFFSKKDVSDLSSTIMEDATQIEVLFSHSVPQLYAAVITTVLIAISMIVYDYRLAIAVFWVVPVAVAVFIISRKLQLKMHQGLYGKKRSITDKIQEGIELAHEIKAYNIESRYLNKLNGMLDSLEKSMIKSELVVGSLVNLSYIILKLGLPTVLLYGGYLFASSDISIFTYLAFIIITARVYNPIIECMSNLAILLYLQVRIKRLKEMDKMPKQEGISDIEINDYDIEFKNVEFSYEEDLKTIKGISFIAKQGEVTALVGPSGGGKSTVAKLAARFWDIDKGTITLGTQDISLVNPETILRNFSIVFQDVTLFNSSVMENIRLGNKNASDSEVIKAAKLARCDSFIDDLPDKYNTLIGENGTKLSGGERQRISIARAILKDAPVILLDEATASLDTKNESQIQKALSELIKDKTVLIIAHRMRTVLGADKIIVIKDGEIAQMGSPDELIKSNGVFKSMLKAQQTAI